MVRGAVEVFFEGMMMFPFGLRERNCSLAKGRRRRPRKRRAWGDSFQGGPKTSCSRSDSAEGGTARESKNDRQKGTQRSRGHAFGKIPTPNRNHKAGTSPRESWLGTRWPVWELPDNDVCGSRSPPRYEQGHTPCQRDSPRGPEGHWATGSSARDPAETRRREWWGGSWGFLSPSSASRDI